MEISNGGRPNPLSQPASRPQPPVHQPANNVGVPHDKKPRNKKDGLFGFTIVFGVLLVGIAVIVIAIIFFVINNTVKSEASYVNKNAYQAVFVNVTGSSGGQAYFGHIQEINSQYIKLTGVFYLEPGATSNQFTLNNLSCALYSPDDTMIIKTAQVAFWENLKGTSQVTNDINKWYSNKLQCTTSSAASTSPSGTTSSTTGSTATSGSTTTGSTTNPSTSTTTTTTPTTTTPTTTKP